MSDKTSGADRAATETGEIARNKRWGYDWRDVPKSFNDSDLLRSIAAYSRSQASSAKATAFWVKVIGLVVLVIAGLIAVETAS